VSEPNADWEELFRLVAGLRAHVELLRATGAKGVPPNPEATSHPVGIAVGPDRRGAAPMAPPAREAPPTAQAVGLPAPEPSAPPQAMRSPAVEHAESIGADAAQALAQLREEVTRCQKCPLCRGRTQTVFARGTNKSGICFVGEGPGEEEDLQGAPFVGKAGQLLDRMIAAMGLGREDVYVANVVKCRPPNNRKPEPDEMAACLPYLRRQLDLIEPRVIVALGATAVEGLLGVTEGITRMRGRWRLYQGKLAVMPTFHPAYLLRNPSAKQDVWKDLQAVLRQMGLEPPRRG
jgi:uracil-DNA glycosylase family 4